METDIDDTLRALVDYDSDEMSFVANPNGAGGEQVEIFRETFTEYKEAKVGGQQESEMRCVRVNNSFCCS